MGKMSDLGPDLIVQAARVLMQNGASPAETRDELIRTLGQTASERDIREAIETVFSQG